MVSRPGIDWKAANEDSNGIEVEVSEPKPKDKTAAERQRRYRNKHRNGNGRDVTGEGVTVTKWSRASAARIQGARRLIASRDASAASSGLLPGLLR